MNKYKQLIKIPDRVTQSVFDLPCISAVIKDKKTNTIFFSLDEVYYKDTDQLAYYVSPGDALAEGHDGKWWLLFDFEYDEIFNDKEQ